MEISSEHKSCHLSSEQWAGISLDTCWHGILSKRTGISLYRSSIWAPTPYRALLQDQLTCFQPRPICLRSRRSLKISQRPPSACVVSRRLWRSSSWTSSGWRRTCRLCGGGCSVRSLARLVTCLESLGSWSLLLLQKRQGSQPYRQVVCTVRSRS